MSAHTAIALVALATAMSTDDERDRVAVAARRSGKSAAARERMLAEHQHYGLPRCRWCDRLEPLNRTREESRRVRQAQRLAAKQRSKIRIAADTISRTPRGGAP